MRTENNQLLIKGYILEIGTQEQGETWKKQEFTITTVEKYPKELRISCWNNNTEWLSRCKVNDLVNVFFNVQSRSFNGKWFTEVSAWRIDVDVRGMLEAKKGVENEK
jgi:hypothetical protein